MEELLRRRKEADEKMSAGFFDEAMEIYNSIACQSPKNEEEAEFASDCLIKCSFCEIKTNNLDKALVYANKAIEIVKKFRSQISSDFLATDDIFAPIVSKYELYLGQISEKRGKLFEALQNYLNSEKIFPKIGAKEHILRIHSKLQIPTLDADDEELSLFINLIQELPNEEKVLKSLEEIISFFKEGDISDDLLDSFADDVIYTLFYAIIQLYIENSEIVFLSLIILGFFADFGMLDVFEDISVVRKALDKHWSNSKIFGASINFLSLSITPSSKDEAGFLIPLAHSLNLEITKEEADKAILMLYNLEDKESASIFKENKIVDAIFKWNTESSALLLSKVMEDSEMCKEAVKKGAAEVGNKLLKKIDDEVSLSTGITILYNISLFDNEETQRIASEVLQNCSAMITKNSKNAEIAEKGFKLVANLVSFGVERIKELKFIKLASLIFFVNKRNLDVVKQIIFFLYACAKNNLVNEIKEISNFVPQIVDSSIHRNADDKEVMERSLYLAVVTGHSRAKTLLRLGLEKFPDSDILKSL